MYVEVSVGMCVCVQHIGKASRIITNVTVERSLSANEQAVANL